jgi:hypothetical protein
LLGLLGLLGLSGLLGLAGGCEEPHALLVTLSAEARVDTFDLYVRDRQTDEVVFSLVGEPVDVGDPTRDISEPGSALKLALRFQRSGSYLVHVVGRSNGPLQASTHLYYISGTQQRDIRLVVIGSRDLDGDGFLTREDCEALDTSALNCAVFDCDDRDNAIHPLATDVCGNGVDEDCDGEDQVCQDADGDGSPANEDCDDEDPRRFPGNPEAPNGCPTAEHPQGLAEPHCGDGVDQDCDGQDTACLIDEDCDGVGAERDCDDENPAIHPGATEVCGNGVDENCSGTADEGCVPCDLDGDGYEREDSASGCPRADYPATRPRDCDDTDAGVFPEITSACGGLEGGDPSCVALRLCDGRDNDCDGETDEGCPDPACDGDGDGFQPAVAGCTPPPGQADCDDTDPDVYPGAPDRCGDGVLQNCNLDLSCVSDGDGDSFNADEDCDDTDPAVFPGAVERCNGRDDDCDTLVDEGNPDADGLPLGDRYCNDDPDGLCGDPQGPGRCVCTKVVPATQRDPARVSCPGEDLGALASPRCVFAPQPEIEQCDSEDHDCDGAADDPDGDHLLEAGQACGSEVGSCKAGQVVGCDLDTHTEGAFNPHFLCDGAFVPPQAERCNHLDDDCDGLLPTNERDGDGDGYLGCSGCPAALPAPFLGCDDCAPSDPNRYPGAPERCNDMDDDCDGSLGDDGVSVCTGGTTDCCGGLNLCVDFDSDFAHCGGCGHHCDGFRANRCVNGSCRCGTGAACGSGQQCVGTGTSASCQCTASSCAGGCCAGTTCVGYGNQSDGSCGTGGEICHGCEHGRRCSATGVCLCFGAVNPPAESSCGDGADNDCDGDVDCGDGDCAGDGCGAHGRICQGGSCVCPGGQSVESSCGDGADNDCDGDVDCGDGDCAGDPCGAPGQVCSAGSCTCTPTSCAAGCCAGDLCVEYTAQSDSQCGTGGESCHGCTQGRTCSASGVCLCFGVENPPPESTCDDLADNDCDGAADCSDGDCDGQTCDGTRICTGGTCQ